MNNDGHFEGKGCICYAHSINDCACSNADWTPKEVYELREQLAAKDARIAELESKLKELDRKLLSYQDDYGDGSNDSI
jgi:hypothetical protein